MLAFEVTNITSVQTVQVRIYKVMYQLSPFQQIIRGNGRQKKLSIVTARTEYLSLILSYWLYRTFDYLYFCSREFMKAYSNVYLLK